MDFHNFFCWFILLFLPRSNLGVSLDFHNFFCWFILLFLPRSNLGFVFALGPLTLMTIEVFNELLDKKKKKKLLRITIGNNWQSLKQAWF